MSNREGRRYTTELVEQSKWSHASNPKEIADYASHLYTKVVAAKIDDSEKRKLLSDLESALGNIRTYYDKTTSHSLWEKFKSLFGCGKRVGLDNCRKLQQQCTSKKQSLEVVATPPTSKKEPIYLTDDVEEAITKAPQFSSISQTKDHAAITHTVWKQVDSNCNPYVLWRDESGRPWVSFATEKGLQHVTPSPLPTSAHKWNSWLSTVIRQPNQLDSKLSLTTKNIGDLAVVSTSVEAISLKKTPRIEKETVLFSSDGKINWYFCRLQDDKHRQYWSWNRGGSNDQPLFALVGNKPEAHQNTCVRPIFVKTDGTIILAKESPDSPTKEMSFQNLKELRDFLSSNTEYDYYQTRLL